MKVLHVGCGRSSLPEYMLPCEETRLDIDHRCEPDIVASMTELGDIGKYDVVFTSHSIEHLYPHEVKKALGEFNRVLNDGGYVLAIVPDLEGLKISEDTLYEVNGFKISAMDLIYGHRVELDERPSMAHHTGFTEEIIRTEFESAGFSNVQTKRLGDYNLMAVAVKGSQHV